MSFAAFREKVRVADLYGAITSVVVAMAAFLVIVRLNQMADDKRQDQLRASTLQTEFGRLQTIVDMAATGQPSVEFESSRDRVHSLSAAFLSLEESSSVDSVLLHSAAYEGFAKRVIESARAKKLDVARRMDFGYARPVYDRLSKAVTAFSDQLSAESQKWRQYTMVLSGWSLLLGAVVLGFITIRYQRNAIKVLSLESSESLALASEKRLKALLRNSSDVIAVTNIDGVFRLISGASEAKFSQKNDDLVGTRLASMVCAEDFDRISQLFDQVACGAKPSAEATARFIDGHGGFRHHQIHLTDLTKDPEVEGVLVTLHDVTDRVDSEKQLAHQSFYDGLTGLPNRALFMNRLTHRLKAASRLNDSIVVMMIDLDNFKVVNDSLGHETGDILLTHVSKRLETILRPSDTVARLGGDEYAILLDGVRNVDEASVVAKRILEGLEAQFSIQGRDVFVTASIGIAMTIDHREDPHSLIRDADTAMYRAKGRGKASFVIFDRSMNELAVERLELESDLRSAVENGQFTLRYQPIVDIETSELKEVEVLLRWQHPTRGMVSPVTFIPIAEETGLICPIGMWVLREACAQLSLWRRGFKHYRDLGISVNVSARQFYSVDFVKKVEETLNEFGIEPNRVKLEVTETAMLSDLDRVTVVFDQLRAMGVRIAIDDFGTGYSSMAYLSRLPVDTLKIDRSFVSTLGGDARIDGVVRAMIAMARTLGLDVTSEGIETDEQLTVLRSLGCDSGQGYLFARPLTALGVAQYLSAPRHEPLYRSAA